MSQLNPSETQDIDAYLSYEDSVRQSPLVQHVIKVVKGEDKRLICDVGGASGKFLDLIMNLTGNERIEVFNMELLETYREKQVNPRIRFLHESIIDNSISNNQFDVVTCRHVLHHLVTDSVSNTHILQKHALSELIRMTKPGGYVFIHERVNEIELFGRLIYWLSRTASLFNLRLKYFQIGSVVVNFLSTERIVSFLDSLEDKQDFEVVEKTTLPANRHWKWKITVLMAYSGDLVLKIKKRG